MSDLAKMGEVEVERRAARKLDKELLVALRGAQKARLRNHRSEQDRGKRYWGKAGDRTWQLNRITVARV